MWQGKTGGCVFCRCLAETKKLCPLAVVDTDVFGIKIRKRYFFCRMFSFVDLFDDALMFDIC